MLLQDGKPAKVVKKRTRRAGPTGNSA